jgi:hypothetical protein
LKVVGCLGFTDATNLLLSSKHAEIISRNFRPGCAMELFRVKGIAAEWGRLPLAARGVATVTVGLAPRAYRPGARAPTALGLGAAIDLLVKLF